MFQRFKTFLKGIDDSIKLYFIILLVCTAIAVRWIIMTPFEEGFGNNVRVEFFGFLFDLLIFGLGFSIFNQWNQRKQDIKRWQEEIDDYRGWKEPEAMFRIVGNIKRLNRAGVTNINLRICYLVEADLLGANLTNADLVGANLEGADLRDAQLENADFGEANLKRSRLDGSNLKNARFAHAHLEGASLTDAILEKARFNKARLAGSFFMRATNLEEVDFSFSYLEDAHFDNIEWLNILQKKDAEKKGVKLFLKYYAESSIFGFTIKSKTSQ